MWTNSTSFDAKHLAGANSSESCVIFLKYPII